MKDGVSNKVYDQAKNSGAHCLFIQLIFRNVCMYQFDQGIRQWGLLQYSADRYNQADIFAEHSSE